MREGVGINNFKALKYETRTHTKQKEIEDLIMEKLGKWKFSPDQFASQVSAVLLDKIKVRWDNTIQTIKDIFSQTLKQLVPNLTDAEVKKELKDNENKMILKFNTCLVLMKNVEHVVKNATDVWKDVFHLHKPTEDPMEIKDDDSDKDEDNEEENSPCVTVNTKDYQDLMKDGEEEKEDEAKEENRQE